MPRPLAGPHRPRSGGGSEWTVVREIGIEYAPATQTTGTLDLRAPALVEAVGAGRCLIVDELGLEKNRTVRIECRTLLLDDRSRVLFDSQVLGIDDGYGCWTSEGHIALLRRTRWELWIMDPSGAILDKLDLSTFSRHLPRTVHCTPQGNFLVSFADAVYEVEIAEIDPRGRLLWVLPETAIRIGCPSSICLSERGNLLVADDFQHVVLEIDRAGRVVWRFGEVKNPAGDDQRLSGARCVRPLEGGRRLIADTGNHRILVVEGDRCVGRIEFGDADLRSPTFADRSPDGGYLICDTGNRRVVELDGEFRILRQWGTTLALRRRLSYPRSIELRGDRVLVADTGHDRLLEFGLGGGEPASVRVDAGLFWPRCARRTPSGSLLVADGRHSRILEIAENGKILHELRTLRTDPPRALRDPHDVHMLANGHLLVVDSPEDLIAEVDWDGNVYRVLGPETEIRLKDPHSVQLLHDGSLLISDTGNHRILWVDRQGNVVRELDTLSSGHERYRLSRPRYAEIGPGATLLIVDSGNNRVFASDLEGNLVWELSRIPGSPLERLNQPRWAQLLARDEVLVSDHTHHRIVHLKRRADTPSAGKT